MLSVQGFCLWDTVGCDISDYFGPAAQYIHTALEGGGKVVINCQMGVSRSSVLAMAYMVLARHWALLDVVREFRKRRDIRPNDDFIDQIVELHNEFRRNKEECLKKQKKLSDLPSLARPWHYEYWREVPDITELPFRLSHLADGATEPLMDHIGALNTDIVPLDIVDTLAPESPITAPALAETNSFNYQLIQLAQENPFKAAAGTERRERSASESSWEYYTETEEEEEGE